MRLQRKKIKRFLQMHLDDDYQYTAENLRDMTLEDYIEDKTGAPLSAINEHIMVLIEKCGLKFEKK